MSKYVDISGLKISLNNIRLKEDEMLAIEGAGAKPIINIQRILVPVDTSATLNSIRSHLVTVTEMLIEDEIGPETEYSVYLEYGTGIYAENGQGRKGGWVYKGRDGFVFTRGQKPKPFVRPSVIQGYQSVIKAIETAFSIIITSRWKT